MLTCFINKFEKFAGMSSNLVESDFITKPGYQSYRMEDGRTDADAEIREVLILKTIIYCKYMFIDHKYAPNRQTEVLTHSQLLKEKFTSLMVEKYIAGNLLVSTNTSSTFKKGKY